MRALTTAIALVLVTVTSTASAQPKKENSYAKLGEKYLLDGDFKMAVSHLEKSLPADSNNAEVLFMLGYSYYHTGNYSKSVSSFTRAISQKPYETSSYYYRGKARNILATQNGTTLPYAEREKLLQAGIKDFSKAIEMNGNDVKLYQNRGLAYRDLGILKSQKTAKVYDKAGAAAAYKSCMTDLQRVLDSAPAREDIQTELKKAKVYLANLDN